MINDYKIPDVRGAYAPCETNIAVEHPTIIRVKTQPAAVLNTTILLTPEHFLWSSKRATPTVAPT